MNKIIRNLKFLIGRTINNSRFLFHINYLRSEKDKLIINPDKDICIEGFPRSGNSYFVMLLRRCNPEIKIANHIHSPVQLIKAINLGIPAVMLIRKP